MAPPPARVILTLVKEVCDLDSSSADRDDLLSRIRNLPALYHAISVDDESRAAVDRAVQAGVKHLDALGTRLTAFFTRSNPPDGAFCQFELACFLLECLCDMAEEFQLAVAANALLGCVTLPLICGSLLCTQLPDLHSGGFFNRRTYGADSDMAVDIMRSQTLLMSKMLQLSTAPFVDAVDFVNQLAASEPVLAWLSVATSTVLTLEGPLFRRGASYAQLGLLSIVNDLVNARDFEPYAAALGSNSGLQRSLMQLLMPALHSLAVAMQLPDERRPAHFDWFVSLSVVNILSARELQDALAEQFTPVSGSDVSNPAPRVLQSVLQLFAAAPMSSALDQEDTADMHAQLWMYLLRLLGATSYLLAPTVRGQQRGSTAMSSIQRQHLLQQMLQALPRLPAALSMGLARLQRAKAEQDGKTDWIATPTLVLNCCSNVMTLLRQLSWHDVDVSTAAVSPELTPELPRYPPLARLQEVPALCAASGALMRALPLAAQYLVELERRGPAVDQADEASKALGDAGRKSLPDSLIYEACAMLAAVAHFCSVAERHAWGAADCALASQALWQVHTTLCRCVHSVAASGLPHTLFAKLLIGLNCVHMSATAVSAAQREVVNDSESGAGKRSISTPKHWLAMNAAQAEAVLVAEATSDAELPWVIWSTVLIRGIEGGPRGMAPSPALLQALDHLTKQKANPAAVSRLAALQGREAQPGDELELAQAATARSCAYLRCANLAVEGGPAAREGAGSQRCSRCKAAWYCGTACSHADWRAGHRRVCSALAAARVAERQEQQGAAA